MRRVFAILGLSLLTLPTLAEDQRHTRWSALETEEAPILASVEYALGLPIDDIIYPPALDRLADHLKEPTRREYEQRLNTVRSNAKQLNETYNNYEWSLRKAPVSVLPYNSETGRIGLCMPSAIIAYGRGIFDQLKSILKLDYQNFGRFSCALGQYKTSKWKYQPQVQVEQRWNIRLKIDRDKAKQLESFAVQGNLYVDIHCSDPYLFQARNVHKRELYCKVFELDFGPYNFDPIVRLYYNASEEGWYIRG